MSEWSVADPSDGHLAVCAAILLFGAVLAEEPPHTANGRALVWRRWADLGPGSAKHL